MSTRAKYVPKHRAPGKNRAAKSAASTALTLSSLAAVVTGVAVGGGSLAVSTVSADASTDGSSVSAELSSPVAAGAAELTTEVLEGEPLQGEELAEELAERREQVVSRSDTRAGADPAKRTALSLGAGNAIARTESVADEDPRRIGRMLLSQFGFGASQWSCLNKLWTKESNWRVNADNPTSSAYGIPQSLPGSKMATVGRDWATNPVTQIRWGLGYIRDAYGSPCSAWAHSQANNWY